MEIDSLDDELIQKPKTGQKTTQTIVNKVH